MAVTVVRPNEVTSGLSNYAATGGSSIQVSVADNTDTTYIKKASGVSGTASIIFGMGTTSLSSGQRIRQVRIRARIDTPNTDARCNIYLGTRVNNTNYFASPIRIASTNYSSVTELTSPYLTAAPDGESWDQNRLDALRIQLTEYKDSTDRTNVYALYADVDIATRPTVTVSSPTGTVTTPDGLEVNWSYSDVDGDAQRYYQVRIISSSVYTAGSFDAETSDAVWESGEVISPDTATAIGAYLADGTYRAYVRVAKTINGLPFWSLWAYSTFTASLGPMPAPTLTGSFNSASNSVALTVAGTSPALKSFANATIQLQRSDDGGATWVNVRDADALAQDASYRAYATDYEAMRGITARYRARQIGYTGAILSSTSVAGPWSTALTLSITNDGKWWIKSMTNPLLNMGGVRVLGPELSFTQEESVGVFRPLGRTRPIVISGYLYGQDSELLIASQGASEWASVAALAQRQDTLFVQDPFGQQVYIRVVARSHKLTGHKDNPIRYTTLNYVEVEG